MWLILAELQRPPDASEGGSLVNKEITHDSV